MKELITLLTCTGGRASVFNLCQNYVARQTVAATHPIQWIVVKDTDEIIQPNNNILVHKNIQMEVYQGPKPWREGINTQHFNMDEAIKHVKGEYVFIFEDDDNYRADYIETQLFFLTKFDIVGQIHSRYYNMKERKYRIWSNSQQASLNESAMRRCKLDLLDRAVNSGNLFFDIALWNIVRAERHNFLLYDNIGLVTGMKGLPGKFGIGSGHVPDSSFQRDQFLEKLKEWVGPTDAANYVELMQRNQVV